MDGTQGLILGELLDVEQTAAENSIGPPVPALGLNWTGPKFDEPSLRKPGWVEGAWLQLADGQGWSFPKPAVWLRPQFVDGKVELSSKTTLGAEFDAKVRDCENAESAVDRIRSLFTLGADLLRRNYTLTDAQVGDLLTFQVGNEAEEDMLSNIYNVAVGVAPKPSTAGSA